MAVEPIRTANAAGSMVVVLDAALEGVLWANQAGAALLASVAGPEGSDRPSQAVLRQIRSASEALAAKGRTQLLLRPADAAIGRAVLARLETVTVDDRPVAALTVRLETGTEGERELAARLLSESGLSSVFACVVGARGLAAATDALPPEEHSLLAAQGQEFLAAGEERLTVEDEGGALSFAKVAEGLVLIHLDMIDGLGAQSGAAAPLAEIAAPVARVAEISIPDDDDGGEEGVSAEDARPVDEAAEIASSGPFSGVRDDPASGTRPDADEQVAPRDAEPAEGKAAFVAALGAEPVRFVWQIDAAGRFSQLSPEFGATVGPHAADVIGRSFGDVAQVFGFDENGEIARLLARRDTWSGRSILWPLEGTDRRAPVDLAALPIYGRDRVFEGFRGFGVVRPAESHADPAAIGMALTTTAPTLARDEAPAGEDAAASLPVAPATNEPMDEAPVSFGRRAEPPAGSSADERRRAREASLSSAEEAAFRAIGAELGLRPLARDERAPAHAATPANDAGPAARSPAEATPPDEPAGEALLLPVQELEDMLDALPLAVLVQMQDRLIFANKRFFTLTLYPDLDALEDAGGLDHLVAACGEDESDGEAVLTRADGTSERARLHLQRISVAGRSCLMMSFPPAEAPPEEDLASCVVDLEREVEELQAVLDTATDGILLLDENECLRKMNGSAEALFGLTPGQYLGLPFADLLAGESRQVLTDYIGTLRDNGLASILNDGREIVARVADGGATIPLFVTLGRLSLGRGWCVIIRDIAQWKRVENDLVEARRQAEDASLHKSRFLANISHELRTPLNAIIGFADVMASECFGPIGHERYLEYLGDIKRSGHHVLDLVNDLLDISKIEAGKVDLAFESVSLNDVVAEVVSLMQPQANRERVIVRSVLPASVPPVVADRRSVRQIALNLIANAVRFTPAGGQIVASTHYGGEGEVTLRFRDSGIGMTEREIEIALTPFQQVNAAGRGRGEGTGLGLPLTKAMAEANRAHFTIASTPGEGTLVEIVFPAQRVLAG